MLCDSGPRRLPRLPTLANLNAAALPDFQPPLLCQGSVRFRNRIEVDAQVHCQLAYGRQRLARLECPFHAQRSYLVHDLPVDRRGAIENNSNLQRPNHCMQYMYTIRFVNLPFSENPLTERCLGCGLLSQGKVIELP